MSRLNGLINRTKNYLLLPLPPPFPQRNVEYEDYEDFYEKKLHTFDISAPITYRLKTDTLYSNGLYLLLNLSTYIYILMYVVSVYKYCRHAAGRKCPKDKKHTHYDNNINLLSAAYLSSAICDFTFTLATVHFNNNYILLT